MTAKTSFDVPVGRQASSNGQTIAQGLQRQMSARAEPLSPRAALSALGNTATRRATGAAANERWPVQATQPPVPSSTPLQKAQHLAPSLNLPLSDTAHDAAGLFSTASPTRTREIDPMRPEGSDPSVAARGRAAKGPVANPSRKLSTQQLHQLNPRAGAALGFRPSDWYGMFKDHGFTAPMGGTTAVTTTQPIALGAGLSIPAGTTVSDEYGVHKDSGPIESIYASPGVIFHLPSGKEIRLMADLDLRTSNDMIRVTFDDGRFHRFMGSAFFNPKTGALTRVVQTNDSAITREARQYRIWGSLVDASLAGKPASNGAMSGRDAEAALRSMLV